MHVHLVWTMKFLMPPKDHRVNGNDGVYELIGDTLSNIKSIIAPLEDDYDVVGKLYFWLLCSWVVEGLDTIFCKIICIICIQVIQDKFFYFSILTFPIGCYFHGMQILGEETLDCLMAKYLACILGFQLPLSHKTTQLHYVTWIIYISITRNTKISQSFGCRYKVHEVDMWVVPWI